MAKQVTTDNKTSKLQAALDKLEKQFGAGSVMRMGDAPIEAIEVIPTGSLTVDIALGVFGVPRGRIIEIYGPESSGKTSLCLHIIAEAQKLGDTCAFIDAEHAFDKQYAQNLGVDVKNLLFSQPSNGEEALEIVDGLAKSGEVALIIVDSVAALTPRGELEGEMGDSKMGLHARLMSQALRKITGSVSKENCTIIFINQLREKIGVMFGSPEVTTGGNALKFYASVRIDIRRSTQIKDGDTVEGNRTKVKIVKNKVSAPATIAEFDIIYGKGISKSGEIIDIGIMDEVSLIKKAGSWFSLADGTKIGQGRDAAKQFLEDNPELMFELEQKIKERFIL